jgi:hypothetical protein
MKLAKVSLRWLTGLALAGALFSQSAACADLWTATGTGTGGDGPISGSANFIISAGQIQVIVTNLLSATASLDQGEAVSGVKFTISNAPGTNSSNTASGQLVNVGSSGNVTNISGTLGNWISSTTGGFGISGNTITLEAIGHGNSVQMVLPASAGPYNVNPGFASHNPYVDGPATFTLNLSGVTANTTITAVKISFGTSPDTTLDATEVTTVPEPSTLAIAGLGTLAFVGYGLRKRLKK